MLQCALCFSLLKSVARLTISFHFLALGSKSFLTSGIRVYARVSTATALVTDPLCGRCTVSPCRRVTVSPCPQVHDTRKRTQDAHMQRDRRERAVQHAEFYRTKFEKRHSEQQYRGHEDHMKHFQVAPLAHSARDTTKKRKKNNKSGNYSYWLVISCFNHRPGLHIFQFVVINLCCFNYFI